jgi:excisionase family DNA binding protein
MMAQAAEAVQAPARWYTPAEVAARLRVSENTVIRWFQRGHLPGLSEGTVYRLSAPFVDAVAVAAASGPVTISALARQWAAS